jgi:hypothetical protein
MRRQRRGFGIVAAGSLAAVLGCAPPLSLPAWEIRLLLNRASFDLSCAGSALHMTTIDANTRGVRGCGRQATYVRLCDNPSNDLNRSCVWLMNGARPGDHQQVGSLSQ